VAFARNRIGTSTDITVRKPRQNLKLCGRRQLKHIWQAAGTTRVKLRYLLSRLAVPFVLQEMVGASCIACPCLAKVCRCQSQEGTCLWNYMPWQWSSVRMSTRKTILVLLLCIWLVRTRWLQLSISCSNRPPCVSTFVIVLKGLQNNAA